MIESGTLLGKALVKKVLLSVILALILAVSITGTAYAGTLLTYSGTGIHNKTSVSTAYVNNSTCYVRHNQTRDHNTNYSMTVSIQKSDWFSWSTKGAKTFYNNVYNNTFSTYCESGTYRLNFQSSISGYTFAISGSFYN